MSDQALITLQSAIQSLAECKNAIQAKNVIDVCETARVLLARQNASREAVDEATKVRLMAEKQMGEFLRTTPKNIGGDPVPHGNRVGEPPTLAEIGITKKQSARAQKLAVLTDEEFNKRIENVKASGLPLSTNKILNPPPEKLDGEMTVIPPTEQPTAKF